ncbi:hypothetical protein Tco_1417494 [Tanacetum coccineum]
MSQKKVLLLQKKLREKVSGEGAQNEREVVTVSIGRSAHEDQIKDVALDVANSPFAYRNLGDSGLGGAHVFITWFMEFVPTLTRGTWMISFFVSCLTGTSAEALLAWRIVERFGWSLLLGVSSFPSLLTLFLISVRKMWVSRRILDWGAKLNKRLLLLPEGGFITAHTDENTHNVQPSTNISSAPPMIGRSAHEDQIKDVALDVANSPFAYRNLGDLGQCYNAMYIHDHMTLSEMQSKYAELKSADADALPTSI